MIVAQDPWLPRHSSPAPASASSTSFEDNFVNPSALPDSAEYIACLERKLERVKRGRGKSSKILLESLEERRRDCISRLLTEDFNLSPTENEEYTDENVPTKWLKSYLNPEQALTVSELIELVEADYLARESDKINTEKIDTSVVEEATRRSDKEAEEDDISLSSISQDLSVSDN